MLRDVLFAFDIGAVWFGRPFNHRLHFAAALKPLWFSEVRPLRVGLRGGSCKPPEIHRFHLGREGKHRSVSKDLPGFCHPVRSEQL